MRFITPDGRSRLVGMWRLGEIVFDVCQSWLHGYRRTHQWLQRQEVASLSKSGPKRVESVQRGHVLHAVYCGNRRRVL